MALNFRHTCGESVRDKPGGAQVINALGGVAVCTASEGRSLYCIRRGRSLYCIRVSEVSTVTGLALNFCHTCGESVRGKPGGPQSVLHQEGSQCVLHQEGSQSVLHLSGGVAAVLRIRNDFVSDPDPATRFQSSGYVSGSGFDSGSDPNFFEHILKL